MLILSDGLVEVPLIIGKLDTLSFKLAKLLTWRNYIYSSQSLECKVLGAGVHQVFSGESCEAQCSPSAPWGTSMFLFIFVSDVNSKPEPGCPCFSAALQPFPALVISPPEQSHSYQVFHTQNKRKGELNSRRWATRSLDVMEGGTGGKGNPCDTKKSTNLDPIDNRCDQGHAYVFVVRIFNLSWWGGFSVGNI